MSKLAKVAYIYVYQGTKKFPAAYNTKKSVKSHR